MNELKNLPNRLAWSYDGPYREEGDIIPVKKIKQHFGVE